MVKYRAVSMSDGNIYFGKQFSSKKQLNSAISKATSKYLKKSKFQTIISY